MQVSFVINAVKRYWWVVLVSIVALASLATFLKLPLQTQYESKALMLISPPSNSGYVGTQSDRYATNEIEVLRSSALAKSIAERLGGVLPPAVLRSSVVVELTPASDVVSVTATATTPELAQKIADGYTTVYLEQLGERVNADQDARLAELNARIDSTQAELDELSTQIQDVMDPFVSSAVNNGNPVPALAEVNPALDSRRVILQNQYDTLLTAATNADLNSRLRVTSQVVQPAAIDPTPIADSLVKFLIAGIIAGAFLGVAAAVMLARSSRSVLDDEHAEQLLGRSIFGRHPSLAAADLFLWHLVDPGERDDEERFVHRLTAQVEAFGKPRMPLSVLVVGALPDAGCTTLACELSACMNSAGRDVLLVDADLDRPDVTAAFASRAEGVSEMVVGFAPPGGRALPNGRVGSIGELRVAGQLSDSDRRTLRAAGHRHLELAGVSIDDALVFDGGSLLESAPAMRLGKVVDVVIVAVPTYRMRTRALRDIAAQLDTFPGAVLVVKMPAVQHGRRRTAAVEAPALADAR